MMSNEPFIARVRALRETWQERREVKGLATDHDFQPQFQLLLTIHRWAVDAARQVGEVYGESLRVAVGSPPNTADPTFQFTIDEAFSVAFALAERRRMGSARWHITVSVVAGPGAGVVAAGPERRNGQWTRARMEDVLLGLLGAYERSLADDTGVDSRPAGRRVKRLPLSR